MKLNYSAPDDIHATDVRVTGRLWLPAKPKAACDQPDMPATELDLQCWELWALSANDVMWFAVVTAAASVWAVFA